MLDILCKFIQIIEVPRVQSKIAAMRSPPTVGNPSSFMPSGGQRAATKRWNKSECRLLDYLTHLTLNPSSLLSGGTEADNFGAIAAYRPYTPQLFDYFPSVERFSCGRTSLVAETMGLMLPTCRWMLKDG